MYKLHISNQGNKTYEEVAGIDKLLVKLEYNAISDEARIAER